MNRFRATFGKWFFGGILLFCIPNPLMAQEIRVGTWKTAQTIQPFFYQNFLPADLKSTLFTFTNPADQKVALLAGSLDICGSTIAHAIHSASRGQPVVLVATLCHKCSALVVKKQAVIETIKDLEGKKIGYVPGTMHELLLREALTRQGLLPERDVRLVRVDFFDMGMALARGSIDAFLSGEPFPTMAVEQGYGKILSYPYYDESIGTINAGMLVTRSRIEENPELIYQTLLAHARATQYLKEHRDQWLKRASTYGTPLAILKKAAENIELAWQIDASFVKKARALGKRMQELGIIEKQPDYDQLFDLTFVKKVTAKIMIMPKMINNDKNK